MKLNYRDIAVRPGTMRSPISPLIALPLIAACAAPFVEPPKSAPATVASAAKKCPPTEVTISPDKIDFSNLDKDGRSTVLYDLLGRFFNADLLFELLKHPDPEVRVEVIVGISNFSHLYNGDYIHPRAVAALTEVIADDNQPPRVKEAALSSLTSIARDGGPLRYLERARAQYALRRFLSNSDNVSENTRNMATYALALFYINGYQIESPGWLGESIGDLLKSDDSLTRSAVYGAVQGSETLHGEGRPKYPKLEQLFSVLQEAERNETDPELKTHAMAAISGI